jgi:hypothetical protein
MDERKPIVDDCQIARTIPQRWIQVASQMARIGLFGTRRLGGGRDRVTCGNRCQGCDPEAATLSALAVCLPTTYEAMSGVDYGKW